MEMKNKFWLVSLLVLVLSVGSVSAIDTTDLILYHSFDNDDIDISGAVNVSIDTSEGSSGKHNLTLTKLTTGETGILGEAYSWAAEDAMAQSLTFTQIGGLGNYTINMWIKTASGEGFSFLIDHDDGEDSALWAIDGDSISGNPTFFSKHAANTTIVYDPTTALDRNKLITAQTWLMATFVYNGTHIYHRVNSTYQDWHATNANSGNTYAERYDSFTLGLDSASLGQDYDGMMDELSVWNRTLTDAELGELWNNGVGLNPTIDVTAPVISNQRNYTIDRLAYTTSAQSSEDGQCTLFGNWTGSWAQNESQSVTAAIAFNFTTMTLNPDVNYLWSLNCSDNSGNEALGTNVSFTTADATPPIISNQINYTNDKLDYTMSAQSNEDGQCTLFGNWTGSWLQNESQSVTAAIKFNFTTMTFNPDTNILWGLNCSDNFGNEVWGTNYSFVTADQTAPTISNQENATTDKLTYTFKAQIDEGGSCSLFGNWSGSWAMNETKSFTADTLTSFTAITFDQYGSNYFWGLNCSDNSANEVWGTNYSFTINAPPTTPSLSTPANTTQLAPIVNLTWSASSDPDGDSITYHIEIDDDINFGSPEDSDLVSNTFYEPSLPAISGNYFYWRVLATDTHGNSSWSETWQFRYQWGITFNVTDIEDGANMDAVIITCNYSSFDQNGDTTTPYGPYTFPQGQWQCSFDKNKYYLTTQAFTADENKTVSVQLSNDALTVEEHTWLESLYNCIIGESCDLFDIIEEINQTTDHLWNNFKRTDASVVLNEEIINTVVNATHNLTIDYEVYVPVKEGYSTGDLLPIRVKYWFLDTTNTTCYNQGTQPTGVESPYCQSLIAYALGPMDGNVNFTVDLRPTLPSGTYSIVREIEIDPNDVWINYGQEIIGTIEVLGDQAINEITGAATTIPKAKPLIGLLIAIGLAGTCLTGYFFKKKK